MNIKEINDFERITDVIKKNIYNRYIESFKPLVPRPKLLFNFRTFEYFSEDNQHSILKNQYLNEMFEFFWLSVDESESNEV